MRTMKHSGIEWLGEIPEKWVTKRLKYIGEVVLGKMLCSTNPGDYFYKPYLKSKNIQWLKVDISSVDEMWFSINELELYRLKKGDLVLSEGGEVGKTCLWNGELGECYIQNSAHKVTINKDNNNKYYLYLFYVYGATGGFNSIVRAISIAHLTKEKLANVLCPSPSIEEQNAIINFLDEKCGQIDTIINGEEKFINELKEYKKSIIQKTVTKGLSNAPLKDSNIEWIGKIPENWEVRKLKYSGSARNGLTYSPADMTGEGILVLRSSNIQDGSLSFNDNVFVNMQIPEELILQENDLLICSRNGSRELIGKCALIDGKTAGNTFGAFMCIFRSQYNRFIYYVFQSNLFTFYLGNYLTATVNQLTISNLNNMEIPITLDLEEQKAIVNYLDEKCGQIDSLIKIKQKKISELKEYKKSLIYEYVTGKKQPPLKDKI